MQDPLLRELATLDRAEPSRQHAEAVRRAALDCLEAPLPPPRLWATLLVAGTVVGYFCWSLFVVFGPSL